MTNRYRASMLCCGALLFFITSIVAAQQTNIVIRVPPESLGRVVIEGTCAPTNVWSFRDSYAGVLNLGSRVEGLSLYDASGAEIPHRNIAPGQFQAIRPASRFRYEVSLTPPARGSDAALVSWLNTEHGLLMLADLLPVVQSPAGASEKVRDEVNRASAEVRATVRLSLPEGWSAYSNEIQNGREEFQVADVGRAVFVLGRNLRTSRTTISKTALNLVTDGEWAFADSEVLEMAGKVLKANLAVFGTGPANQVTLILFPFPQTVAADRWSAEARGSTVTLLMGKLPSKTAALAQLSVPLTHELFHLWVPNALALNGDYDWFYEGFTVYQAARSAVRLDLLTFPEFLNAIARAYDSYLVGADRDRWSLIEASRRRWTTGSSAVYQKSMLVAFLYDLKLRNQSRGKRSLDDVYRRIFKGHRLLEADSGKATAGEGSDGNDAATSALASDAVAQDFVQRFIRDVAAINLQAELAPFGLRVERFGLRTRISVGEQLSKQQRDLLRELGYNDYARSPRKR